MPIAREPLRIGNLVVAREGNYVSRSAVEHYGWQDQVDDDDGFGPTSANITTVELPPPADTEIGQPKRRRRKAPE